MTNCMADFLKALQQCKRKTPYLARLKDLATDLAGPKKLQTADFLMAGGEATRTAIVDIQVISSKKDRDVPEGFELVHSLGSGGPANLTRSGRPVYLCYKKGKVHADVDVEDLSVAPGPQERKKIDADLPPITALSIIFTDMREEPPHGFEPIVTTSDGKQSADLNAEGGPNKVFLCFLRGDGPPLHDIVVAPKGAEKPSGLHEIKYTTFGHKASVTTASDGKTPALLCFKPDVANVLAAFQSFGHCSPTLVRCVATLTASLYAYDEGIVAKALTAFNALSEEGLPPDLYNIFVHSACNAIPVFLSYFTTQTHIKLLEFFERCCSQHLRSLSLSTIMKMIEACFMLRHEDKKTASSEKILNALINASAAFQPCSCHMDGKQDTSRLACFKCSWRGTLAASSSAQHVSSSILKLLIHNISQVKSLESQLRSFQRHSTTGRRFRADVARIGQALFEYSRRERDFVAGCQEDGGGGGGNTQSTITHANTVVTEDGEGDEGDGSGELLVHQLDIDNKEERALFAIVLVCCKFATEQAAFDMGKSEMVKRKLHGLSLVSYILVRGNFFFRKTKANVYLLRRFIVPSLMSCCITDVPSMFRAVLQSFITLWDNLRGELMIELGVFMDFIFLELLESKLTPHDQKKDIIDVFFHILKTPRDVIFLFYNYDNATSHWALYEKLISVLAKITEGDFQAMVARRLREQTEQQMSPEGTEPAPRILTHEEIAEEALQRHALRLLVQILRSLAQWISVPTVTPVNAIEKGQAGLGTIRAAKQESVVEQDPEFFDAQSRKHAATWAKRTQQHEVDEEVRKQVLQRAKVGELSKALLYLKSVNARACTPHEVAKFLYHSTSLDKSQVGDVLGGGGDKLFSKEDYDKLRYHYVSLLDFTSLSFDDGIRLFLCDGGFRLPGEAQKIDRLLEACCQGYCRDNPGVFRETSSAFVLCFALIMLNTETHDSRLDAGKGKGRQKMTLEQFISNLRGVDDGHDFPREYLESLYESIRVNAIEWKAGQEKNLDHSAEDRAKTGRKLLELFVRKGMGHLRSQAFYSLEGSETKAAAIVRPMFENSWFKFMTAITSKLETKDQELLHLCTDGLAYGSCIAILFGLDTERQAFARVLAKVTFVEKEAKKKGLTDKQVKIKIIQTDHLKQQWYRPLSLMCEKDPRRACKAVLDVARDVKTVITRSRQQAVLKRFENDLAGDVALVDGKRLFVKKGKLVKIAASSSSQKKKTEYMFYLFNDLILYAASEAGVNGKRKVHRVIHLSLCRIVDMQNATVVNAFKIVSPQKSILLTAPTPKEKTDWIAAIHSNLLAVMELRTQFFKKASPPSPTFGTSLGVELGASGDENILRRYSTFIGQSASDLNADGKKVAAPNCKLCIKAFALLRRKMVCRMCQDTICVECCKQTTRLPGKDRRMRKVCDACYGALKGMVGHDVPLLSTNSEDTS